jgi:hypothetical protein
MIKIGKNLKIVEEEGASAIVYEHPFADASNRELKFDQGGIYIDGVNVTSAGATSVLSSALMPKAYSSAFQTATLANSLLPLANSTQWATGTLSSALMPLGYSSACQTATLSNTFGLKTSIYYSNIVGFSWSSSISGNSISVYLVTA